MKKNTGMVETRLRMAQMTCMVMVLFLRKGKETTDAVVLVCCRRVYAVQDQWQVARRPSG